MSQATYKTAIEFVAKWEWRGHPDGMFTNDPDDPGGATKYGVIQTTYDQWRRKKGLAQQSVELATMEEAFTIYREDFWDIYKSKGIPLDLDDVSPEFAVAIFDSGVNCGTGRAYRWGCEALKENEPVKHLLALREQHYINRVRDKPSQGKFLKGWINRLNDLKKLVQIIQQDALP
jgi:lysozyme family protein